MFIDKKKNLPKRAESIKNLKHRSTIAQFNKVSVRTVEPTFHMLRPVRIILPDFFNVPSYKDRQLILHEEKPQESMGEEDGAREIKRAVMNTMLKKRMKDLSLLAEGMKRSKNIKEESRYYFIQGVMLHNAGIFGKAIDMFDKFLKIVLFIKDEKSVQLALNAIGSSCMYLNDFQKAIQYHQKQVSIIENADQFTGKVNCGLCYELMGQYDDAHRQYQEAYQIQQKGRKNIKKIKFASELIQRVQSSMLSGEMFMTEKLETTLPVIPLKKLNSCSQEKSKQMYRQKMDHSPSRKIFEKAKIGYAVCKAEQKLNKYIENIKYSFEQENSGRQHSF